MDEKRATELIETIGVNILDDPEFSNLEWDSLALVAHVEGAISISGFKYTGKTAHPAAPQNFEIHGLILDLLDATSDHDNPPWKACLVQIIRDSLDIQLDFEHDDADRWRITPENLDSIPELLRPV